MPWAIGALAIISLAWTGAPPGHEPASPKRPILKLQARRAFVAPKVYLPNWSELPAETRANLQRRLIVKFLDAARCRAQSDGSLSASADVQLEELEVLSSRLNLRFTPAIGLSTAGLAALEQRAAVRSGRAQPDLGGILEVVVPAGRQTDAWLLEVGRKLEALDIVEFASIETLGCPPPGDIAPPTPDLTGNQGHLGPDPGQDSSAVIGMGLTGAGIRVSDCEYNWNLAHEDLVDKPIGAEPGQTPVFNEVNIDHGTAVVGSIVAGDNGYGVVGVSPGVDMFTYSEWTVEGGSRRLAAITAAIADSGAGDIVLLEMQDIGLGHSYGPAELNPAVHLVTQVGTDAGVVVVAAAGNGNQDLDHWLYASYMAMGDSGALIVGAGTTWVPYHAKWFYSTFGSRVNVQGWGDSVFTTGFGQFATYGGDPNQEYTATFTGTSSAAGLVAGACALIQERAFKAYGQPFGPLELRARLIATGVPLSGLGGPIGPALDVAAAVQAIQSPWADLGFGLAGAAGEPLLVGIGQMAPGTTNELVVSNVAPSTTGWWIAGFSRVLSPLFGGTLVPAPLIILPMASDTAGEASLSFIWPTGLPPGFALYSQAWFADVTGPQGLTASNGLKGS